MRGRGRGQRIRRQEKEKRGEGGGGGGGYTFDFEGDVPLGRCPFLKTLPGGPGYQLIMYNEASGSREKQYIFVGGFIDIC